MLADFLFFCGRGLDGNPAPIQNHEVSSEMGFGLVKPEQDWGITCSAL